MNTHTLFAQINRYIFREMDSPKQQTFEGLQAIHVEERKVFDALYSKEMRQNEMFKWAQGRMAKLQATQQRRTQGKRDLEERQEQEISELWKVHAHALTLQHTQLQIQEQARLHKLTLRQTACDLDDVPMIFPVITE